MKTKREIYLMDNKTGSFVLSLILECNLEFQIISRNVLIFHSKLY